MKGAASSGRSTDPASFTEPVTGAGPVGTTAAVPTLTPDAQARVWTSALDRFSLRHPDTAREFLEHLAHDHAGSTSDAHTVFNDLIANEAGDLFAEAFSAHNKLLQAHAKTDGEVFKSTLSLQLPKGWRPRAPQALSEALARVQVQRVAVWRDRGGSQATIPEAVSELVGVLLSRAGVTELAVWGALEDVETVAAALQASERFAALELGEEPQADADTAAMSSLEQKTYEALLGYETARSRLQRLTLHQSSVLPPLMKTATTSLWGWPTLSALCVKELTLDAAPSLRLFLKTVAASQGSSPKLSEVSLSFFDPELENPIGGLLEDLLPHKALAELRIQRVGFTSDRPSCLDLLGMAIGFARHCPSLRRMHWDSGLPSKEASLTMAAFLELLSVEELRKLRPDIAEALADANFLLEDFSMTGYPLAPGALLSLFEALAVNTSLRRLDLSRSQIELRATQTLLQALRNNTWLRSVLLSSDPTYFYLLMETPRASILGLQQGQKTRSANRSDEPQGSVPVDFQLRDDGTDPALPAFDADLKRHADTLAQQLLAFQRERLGEAAFPELVRDVAQLVASLLRTDTPEHFLDISRGIAHQLEQAYALRQVVRFSELSLQMNHRQLGTENAKPHPADVQPYVMLNNKAAVAQGAPQAPLVVNKVDKHRANLALGLAAVQDGTQPLQDLLDRDAIDFGGRVARRMAPGPQRDVLLQARPRARGSMSQDSPAKTPTTATTTLSGTPITTTTTTTTTRTTDIPSPHSGP